MVGIPGRKPKPTAVKKIEGNPGKRPLNDNEPRFRPGLPHRPPSWMSKEAKKLWKHLVPQLEEIPGLLQRVDQTAMEQLCENYSIWKEAVQTLREKGMVFYGETKGGAEYIQPRPEVTIARNASKLVMEACSQFGFTPSSRGRINLPLPGKDDGFDAL